MHGIFIDDGQTFHKTFPARPGLHPEVRVVYRPALYEARAEYQALVGVGDHARASKFGADLIARQVVEIGGRPVTPDQARRIVPALRQDVVDLVLGYFGSDEDLAEKKD